jgi:hypothetical protein
MDEPGRDSGLSITEVQAPRVATLAVNSSGADLDSSPAAFPESLPWKTALLPGQSADADLRREITLQMWAENPSSVFADLCSSAIAVIEHVAWTQWEAERAAADVLLSDLCLYPDRFRYFLAVGKAIWESGLLTHYLTRQEAIRVAGTVQARSPYDACCFH